MRCKYLSMDDDGSWQESLDKPPWYHKSWFYDLGRPKYHEATPEWIKPGQLYEETCTGNTEAKEWDGRFWQLIEDNNE